MMSVVVLVSWVKVSIFWHWPVSGIAIRILDTPDTATRFDIY